MPRRIAPRPPPAASRGLRGEIGEVVNRLFAWVDTASDSADDSVSVSGDLGEQPRMAWTLSPPGFYALATTGLRGLAMRLRAGALLLGTYTAPPPDAAAGESGIYLAGALVRVRPDGRVDVIGGTPVASVEIDTAAVGGTITLGRKTAASVKAVARDTDAVNAAGVQFLAWVNAIDAYVRGFVPGLPPPPVLGTAIGAVTASTLKTFSG